MLNLFKKITQEPVDSFQDRLNKDDIPKHVAIIMDGNGRWAKQRGLPRTAGHKKGVGIIESIVEAAGQTGVEMLTVYAFSTENWNRPEDEISYIMSLPERFFASFMPKVMEANMQLRCIGDLSRLTPKVQTIIQDAMEQSADNTGMIFNIAVNYGGRLELVRATQKIAQEVAKGTLAVEEINEAIIGSHLYTPELPDVELLIRTSGEERVSNFLLWQIAYAEFYFTDTLWPDFTPDEFHRALYAYQNRDRRKGGLTQSK
ncbi:MAG: isoprenyl transferase [Culicoidibacterales bacterium]